MVIFKSIVKERDAVAKSAFVSWLHYSCNKVRTVSFSRCHKASARMWSISSLYTKYTVILCRTHFISYRHLCSFIVKESVCIVHMSFFLLICSRDIMIVCSYKLSESFIFHTAFCNHGKVIYSWKMAVRMETVRIYKVCIECSEFLRTLIHLYRKFLHAAWYSLSETYRSIVCRLKHKCIKHMFYSNLFIFNEIDSAAFSKWSFLIDYKHLLFIKIFKCKKTSNHLRSARRLKLHMFIFCVQYLTGSSVDKYPCLSYDSWRFCSCIRFRRAILTASESCAESRYTDNYCKY